MLLEFVTLDGEKYRRVLERYRATTTKKVSHFQWKWKLFFMRIFPKDFWAEEFPVKPLSNRVYRLDLYNFTRKFAVECHGDQHVSVNPHFHGGSQDKFLDALLKDRQKELWCEKNNIELITTYTSTPMDKEFFKKKYPRIKW